MLSSRWGDGRVVIVVAGEAVVEVVVVSGSLSCAGAGVGCADGLKAQWKAATQGMSDTWTDIV